MKSNLILVALFSVGALHASDFTWEADVLNQKTREKKVYVPTEKELEFPAPGKHECRVGPFLKTPEMEPGEESRILVCGRGNVMIGTRVICNKTVRTVPFGHLQLFDPKGDHVATVTLVCK